jgi:HK97 family phage portal protein
MFDFLWKWLPRFGRKSAPSSLSGSAWSGTGYIDSYKRNRNPTPNELLAELKETAWSCASMNAQACAQFEPALYVVTEHNQPKPKCATRPLGKGVEKRLRETPHLAGRLKSAATIEQVTEHPILALLDRPNPFHSQFDLWELTTLYQEVHGSAYWYLDRDAFGMPAGVWILPSQNVTPKRDKDSPRPVDYYEYRVSSQEQRFKPEEIVHFRYPDPRDPYTAGLGPLRAAYEQVKLTSEYAAFRMAKFENRAVPDAIVHPIEVMGEEERDRIESQWNQKFRRGGAGKVVVAETGLKVDLLSHSLGDLALLADMATTKDGIANAFHVPTAFFTTNTNLANLQASIHQHMSQAVAPRLLRRDERLNAQLVPLYDTSGRLFLASQSPIPVDKALNDQQQLNDIKWGVVTINEVRSERGLPPVPWGKVPWLPRVLLPTDVPRFQPGQQSVADPHVGESVDYPADGSDTSGVIESDGTPGQQPDVVGEL